MDKATSRLKPQYRSGQQQLFRSEQFATPEKGPGDMSMDEWTETQDPVYHGSYRSDWKNAPVAHYGSMGQAVTRIDNVQNVLKQDFQARDRYYDPESVLEGDYDDSYDEDTQATPMTHTGKVYARRLTENPYPARLTDSQANAAEMGHRYENYEEEWQIPASVKESAGQEAPELSWEDDNPKAKHFSQLAEAGNKALDEGRPIKYHNAIEGMNPIDGGERQDSIIAGSGAVSSWERDVLNSKTASPMSQQFAQQRINQGNEGAVPFPAPRTTRQPEQMQIPIAYDENERLSGDIPNTRNRWQNITGQADMPADSQRRTLQHIQFES